MGTTQKEQTAIKAACNDILGTIGKLMTEVVETPFATGENEIYKGGKLAGLLEAKKAVSMLKSSLCGGGECAASESETNPTPPLQKKEPQGEAEIIVGGYPTRSVVSNWLKNNGYERFEKPFWYKKNTKGGAVEVVFNADAFVVHSFDANGCRKMMYGPMTATFGKFRDLVAKAEALMPNNTAVIPTITHTYTGRVGEMGVVAEIGNAHTNEEIYSKLVKVDGNYKTILPPSFINWLESNGYCIHNETVSYYNKNIKDFSLFVSLNAINYSLIVYHKGYNFFYSGCLDTTISTFIELVKKQELHINTIQ